MKFKKLMKDWEGYMMSGISYMIPTIIGGAIIVGIPQLIGMAFGVDNLAKYEKATGFFHMLWQVNQVGWIGIGLVNLVIGGYVAYAIGDKAALGAGFIGGQLATNTQQGFIGAVIAGFVAGYVARWCRKIRVPEKWNSAIELLVTPLLTTGAVALINGLVLTGPLSWLNLSLIAWVKAMVNDKTNGLLVACIMGGMIGFDLGGPVNKAAWATGNFFFLEGIYKPCLYTNIAICAIPLGYALMTFIWPKKRFSAQLYEMGRTNLINGTFGITEGAIPFFLKAPQLIFVNVIGGALGAGVGELMGVNSHIPPLGGLPGILTADNIPAYLCGILACAVFIAVCAPLIANFNTDKKKEVKEDDIKLNITVA
jgi:PTS system fructose-specific IIC component